MNIIFKCFECNYTKELESKWDDPTNSKGCCPLCGGTKWDLLVDGKREYC